MYKVCKFGGSSLANAEQIRKVCDIMLSDPSRRVMVVSAPGKRTREDTKVTDLLIALANALISGYDGAAELQDVLDRFGSIAAELELDAAIMADISIDMKLRLSQTAATRFASWIRSRRPEKTTAPASSPVTSRASAGRPAMSTRAKPACSSPRNTATPRCFPKPIPCSPACARIRGSPFPGFFRLQQIRPGRHIFPGLDPTSPDRSWPRRPRPRLTKTGPMWTRFIPSIRP